MENKIEKKVFYLQIYCTAITLLLGSFFVFGFTTQQKQKFDEIEVKRLNLVDDDGKLRMVIANKDRQHPGMADGKLFDRKRSSAGMLFFDENGNECGGLIFENLKTGDNYRSLTFDKFRGDQTIALQHLGDKTGDYRAFLAFNDENTDNATRTAKMEEIKKMPDEAARKAAYKKMQDDGDFLVNRLLIGRGRGKSTILTMSDAKGTPRINMSVAADGNPKLEFLDEKGKVIYSLPEKAIDKK